jgi:hypothetical protein
MKYTVITTFNSQGLKQYGQRMIDTFEKHWPAEVDLIACAEHCHPVITKQNVKVYDLLQLSTPLNTFIERHRNNPQAHGLAGPPEVFDPKKSFRWDAVRFAYKIYSIALVSNYTSNGWLIWLDADTFTHSNITIADLERLCPASAMISYLGRGERYHSECGWVAYNLDHPETRKFIMELKDMYNQDKIFDLPEWHDSYVWDVIRRKYQSKNQFYNLSPALQKPGRAGHPFINSELGRFMDHLKGTRKTQGHSHLKDLISSRTENYWKSLT